MKSIFKALVLIAFFSSCSKEKQQIIPDVFRPYVDMFIEEGKSRGVNINLNAIEFEIGFGTLSGTIAGQCTFRNNKITIDEESWDIMSEEERVWLIFHEMGHCILNRQHKNETTKNGECLSIMKGAENGFNCSLNYFSNLWTEYYLDELFKPQSQIPAWYAAYENYNLMNVLSTIYQKDTITNFFQMDDLTLPENYEINVAFKSLNFEENLLKLYFGNIGFSHCDRCTGINVRIGSDNPQQDYYENQNGLIQFKSDTKLTIRAIGNNFYFYVNERFVHTFEKDIWDNNKTLRTKHFDEPIELKITINELR